MRIIKTLVVSACLLLPPSAQAALQVLACEPEWAALTLELGGERVQVHSATTARQDPHRIEARPSLLARARNADLLVCTGAELEVGWLPLLLRDSGNPRIQPGRPGYFEAAVHVEMLDVPARLDRALGDLHAAGNPHFIGDPHNLVPVARALTETLVQLDAAHAAHYRARLAEFLSRWEQALARWRERAAPLQGTPVVMQHRNPYQLRWLGLQLVAELESAPGVEPSVAHLTRLLDTLQATPARLILRNQYHAPRPANWLGQRAGIAVVELPATVGGSDAAGDLFGLYEDQLNRVRDAAL